MAASRVRSDLYKTLYNNGDILFLYAVCGLLVIPFIRASNKVILAFAIFLGLQPVELTYILLGLIDPTTPILNLGSGSCWGALATAQATGSMLDVAVAGIRYGLPVNFL